MRGGMVVVANVFRMASALRRSPEKSLSVDKSARRKWPASVRLFGMRSMTPSFRALWSALARPTSSEMRRHFSGPFGRISVNDILSGLGVEHSELPGEDAVVSGAFEDPLGVEADDDLRAFRILVLAKAPQSNTPQPPSSSASRSSTGRTAAPRRTIRRRMPGGVVRNCRSPGSSPRIIRAQASRERHDDLPIGIAGEHQAAHRRGQGVVAHAANSAAEKLRRDGEPVATAAI